MVTVLYRCPNTGFRVQGYTAEEESADHDGHVPVTAVFRKSIATLPRKNSHAGETVRAAAYTTGQLLILRKGLVAVTKEGVEIARATDPGAVFGEISALLDQSHSADVHALTSSQFHVADAAA